jgi:hypothetical protein
MGGKPCLNDEDRLKRKRESALRYYHKNKDKLVKDEAYRERRRISSLKYYYNNQDKCIESACKWTKNNPEKVKLTNKKAYQKRKYGKTIFFIKKPKIETSESNKKI